MDGERIWPGVDQKSELALAGDPGLLREFMDLLLPAKRDRHVTLQLPEIRSAADALDASRLVVERLQPA
jgi:hypothetical protein